MTPSDENPTREHAAGPGLPSPRTPLNTGAVFSKRYRIVRRISAGSMAEVHEVEHLGTRRRLALKVLLPEIATDPVSVERFQREASVCANIDSDHIVQVIDTDVDPESGIAFLVMELLHGKDLAQYIAETWGRGTPIPPSMVLSLMRQVASALDKVHAEGIVHRDLKPANLFLTFPSDGPPRVKILDFGVAKLLREERSSDVARIGTPLYMTPEQLTGGVEPTAATDVWALALITYELLVGAPYWEGNTAASLMERIPDGARHPVPSTLAAARGVTLGPAFDRWLLRCIDPVPAKRPASAGEGLGDLLRLFDPSATQPPTRSITAPRAPAPRTSAPASSDPADFTRDQTQLSPVARPRVPRTAPMPMARPLPTPARRNTPGTLGTPPSRPPPRAPAQADDEPTQDTPVEGSERPTIPATGRQVMSRVRTSDAPIRPSAPGSSAPPPPRSSDRPTVPTMGHAMARPARTRDPGEAKTIKMPTVRTGSKPNARPPMDTVPIPLSRPAQHEPVSDHARLGPLETAPIPLAHPVNAPAPQAQLTPAAPTPAVRSTPPTPPAALASSPPAPQPPPQSPPQPAAPVQAEHAPYTLPPPSRPAPPAVASTPPVTPAAPALASSPPVAKAPTPAPSVAPQPATQPAPSVAPQAQAAVPNTLAQRISLEIENSVEASERMTRRRPDAHALTTVLPAVQVKPASGVSLTVIAIAGAVSLGLTIAAGYVLLHRRVPEVVAANVTPPPAPTSHGLAVTDRTALRACTARWSPALLAAQGTDGGFGNAERAASNGGDTGQALVALLRGHVVGAVVSPERQLQVLRALDASRLARGWSSSPTASAQRQPVTSATAWAAVAYSLMAEESRAETARARVRIARDALVTAQRPDGSFSEDMAPAAHAATDVSSVLATWALVEAHRAEPTETAAVTTARARALTWTAQRVTSGALGEGIDALAFWVAWQGRETDPATRATVDALAVSWSRALLHRCPADRGCAPGVASWEPWTALALSALLRDPPAALDAPTRTALQGLLSLTLSRFSRAADAVSNAPPPALAPWLFAAAELQR